MMRLLLVLVAFLIASCQSSNPSHVEKRADGTTAFSGNAMTMQYKILVGQEITSHQRHHITEIINQTFQDTDTILNKWNPNSELSKLNSQKTPTQTLLSPLLLRLFNETDHIVKLSNGRFDPSIEPLQSLWKEKLLQGKIPSNLEIEAIAPAIGWNKVSFKDGIFCKEHHNTKLDFGGIAKGLCIDLLIERLQDAGFNNAFVEWGGEIRTCGQHPEGRAWTIYISSLGDNDPDHSIATLHLNDQAIATSGDYLQNWAVRLLDEEGKEKVVTYFHIFDPKTLKPLEASYTSIASVSVLAPTCALADGLATVPMLFPSMEEATEWAEEVKKLYPDVSFWIISRSQIKS